MAGEETLNGSFKNRFLLILVIKIVKKQSQIFAELLVYCFGMTLNTLFDSKQSIT